MPNDLEQRQLEYEVRALEHGREDARRKVAGARTPADVEICGGGQNADSAHRRQGLLYKIATVEIPNLIAEIIKKRDEHGTKSAFIFTALAQCGSDADIAFAVVKTFFNTLFCGYDKDDDENGDPEDVSVATMATKVADTVFNLRIRNKKQAKRKKRGKRFALEKKTIKQLSQDEQLRIGMALVQLYLKSTKYYKICPMLAAKNGGFRGPDAVQATDSAFDEILAEFSHSLHAGVASDIERLVRDLISPTWSPMLVPPNPWVAMRNGGYIVELAGKMSLVKGRSKMSGFSMKECPEVFEAINHLQATKFRINTFVFDIYNSLFSDLLESSRRKVG